MAWPGLSGGAFDDDPSWVTVALFDSCTECSAPTAPAPCSESTPVSDLQVSSDNDSDGPEEVAGRGSGRTSGHPRAQTLLTPRQNVYQGLIAADVALAAAVDRPAAPTSPSRNSTSIPSEEIRLSAGALKRSSPVFARSA